MTVVCIDRRWGVAGVAVLVALCIGCGSSAPRADEKAAPAPIRNTVHCLVAGTQRGSALSIDITSKEEVYVGDPLNQVYSNASSVVVVIADGAGTPRATYTEAAALRIEPGSDPGFAKGTLRARVDHQFPDSMTAPLSGSAHVTLLDRASRPMFDTTIAVRFDPALRPSLSMRLFAERMPSGTYKLSMTLRRVHVVANEFTPSMLTHDFIIASLTGRVLWQFSFEQMYGQMLMPVLPAKVGEEYTYTEEWDGTGNVIPGTLPAGRYRLIGIVPSKPVPVRDSTEFVIQ